MDVLRQENLPAFHLPGNPQASAFLQAAAYHQAFAFPQGTASPQAVACYQGIASRLAGV